MLHTSDCHLLSGWWHWTNCLLQVAKYWTAKHLHHGAAKRFPLAPADAELGGHQECLAGRGPGQEMSEWELLLSNPDGCSSKNVLTNFAPLWLIRFCGRYFSANKPICIFLLHGGVSPWLEQSPTPKRIKARMDPRLLASGPLHVLVVDSRTACRKATVGLLEQVVYKVGELYDWGHLETLRPVSALCSREHLQHTQASASHRGNSLLLDAGRPSHRSRATFTLCRLLL